MLPSLLGAACRVEPSYSLRSPVCSSVFVIHPHVYWCSNTPTVLPGIENVFPGVRSEVKAQGMLAREGQTDTQVTDEN